MSETGMQGREQQKPGQQGQQQQTEHNVAERDSSASSSKPNGGGSKVLERGNIYFLFRPKVNKEQPSSLEDVQRMEIILSPHDRDLFRLLVIGRKRLPDVKAHERNWGFVDFVGKNPQELLEKFKSSSYQTETKGDRTEQPVWPAGEGVYAIVQHDSRHIHLAYELELPQKPGQVQEDLEIEKTGSFILAVKNPEKGSPPNAGLQPSQKAEYPSGLMEKFQDRRFIPAETQFLDVAGCELILIGAEEKPEDELGIDMCAEKESLQTADIFKELRGLRREHPLAALLTGTYEKGSLEKERAAEKEQGEKPAEKRGREEAEPKEQEKKPEGKTEPEEQEEEAEEPSAEERAEPAQAKQAPELEQREPSKTTKRRRTARS